MTQHRLHTPLVLTLAALLCFGLVLTVLAVYTRSVTVAWSAGGITVGAGFALWK